MFNSNTKARRAKSNIVARVTSRRGGIIKTTLIPLPKNFLSDANSSSARVVTRPEGAVVCPVICS
jgi:hypothetical protein